MYVSAIICIAAFAVIVTVIRKARQNDRREHESMPYESLCQESFWEAQQGRYPNRFSVERDRREAEGHHA